ncbi:MAG TPA: hypothetical protein VMF89_05230, partial [Polyangiales bacterium]|nr:hypothetical protein [Polyangiales bacterium]
LLGSFALGVSSCSFGKEEDAAEMNTCQVDADCSTQHCESGRCVSDAETTVPVTIVVTPKRMPISGSQVQSIVSDSFELTGGAQDISLRLPVSVSVRVQYKDKPLPAQAVFTPLDSSNRFTARTTRLSLFGADQEGSEPSNKTLLLDGMSYRVLIQPTDSEIPPHSLLFTAKSDAELKVDYADFADKIKEKSFFVHDAARTPFQVRAIAETTGAPISNTTTFTGSITGLSSIDLLFDDPDAAYKLEFTPVDKQSYSTGVAGSCGEDLAQPKLSVPSRLFTPDITTTNRWYVQLPKLHDAVEYSGVIGLCTNQKLAGDLQVSLETSALYLAGNAGEGTEGSFQTAATASWDADSNKFRFCARVPPGSYTVRVTPSPSLTCEMFAERRLLRPEWSGEPDELSLRLPATLTANVLTPDRMPMPRATVDAFAVASGEVMSASEDRSVANYNRSRSVATGADGSFTMAVDRGRYDVFIKPPANSNYAWRVLYDVAIASSEAEFATEIVLSEPVVVTGQLKYAGGSAADQQSLADADVRAYTLVDVEGGGSEMRSVEIGSGTASASGVVTLLLPPSLQHSWNP